MILGLVFLMAFPTPFVWGSAPHSTPRSQNGPIGDDAIRIEAEYKLAVPSEQAGEVWEYLQSRYSPDAEDSLFQDVPGKFTTTFSTELFLDTYFDSPQLELLEQKGGIRHRRRYYPDNPDAKKHGRELVQMKLSYEDEGVNRAEVKFPVVYYPSQKSPLDTHPLLGIVEREQRPALIERIMNLGMSVKHIGPKLTLTQNRQRVYISRDGEAFATLTLDHVEASKWWAKASFVEMELELNEVGYTEGTPEERAFMESINARMKADLFDRFPRLVQDQTPKYNKAFAALDQNLLGFRSALRIGLPIEAVLLVTVAVGVGASVHYQRRRKTRLAS